MIEAIQGLKQLLQQDFNNKMEIIKAEFQQWYNWIGGNLDWTGFGALEDLDWIGFIGMELLELHSLT